MRTQSILAVGAALTLTALATSASAVTFLYAYSSSDGLEGASGTLSATTNGDGTFTATSGTITAFGSVSTGVGTLVANLSAPAAIGSPSGFFTYDDQLLPGANPLITHPGLLFDIGGSEINIFSNGAGPGTYQFYSNTGANDFGNFSLSELAIPEPTAWSLMLVGFGIAGAVARASRKHALEAA